MPLTPEDPLNLERGTPETEKVESVETPPAAEAPPVPDPIDYALPEIEGLSKILEKLRDKTESISGSTDPSRELERLWSESDQAMAEARKGLEELSALPSEAESLAAHNATTRDFLKGVDSIRAKLRRDAEEYDRIAEELDPDGRISKLFEE